MRASNRHNLRKCALGWTSVDLRHFYVSIGCASGPPQIKLAVALVDPCFFPPTLCEKSVRLATSERPSPQIEISSRPHATNGLQTVRPLRSCDRGSSPEATSEDSGITSEFPELSIHFALWRYSVGSGAVVVGFSHKAAQTTSEQ